MMAQKDLDRTSARYVIIYCGLTRRSGVSPQQILTSMMTRIVVDKEHAQTTLDHNRIVFYHNIKDNESNLCQDLSARAALRK